MWGATIMERGPVVRTIMERGPVVRTFMNVEVKNNATCLSFTQSE